MLDDKISLLSHCTAEIEKYLFGLFKINMKYLDADKIEEQGWKIFLKYLDTDKMGAKVVKSELDTFKGL